MLRWVTELSRAFETCKLSLWCYKIQESHSCLDESMPRLHCVGMKYQSGGRCPCRLRPGLKASLSFWAVVPPPALDSAKSPQQIDLLLSANLVCPTGYIFKGEKKKTNHAIQTLQKCNSIFTRSFFSDLSWILGLMWIILCLCFSERLVIYEWENQSISSIQYNST